MKTVKKILSVLFIIGGVGIASENSIPSGICLIILGIILFPTISEKLKQAIEPLNKKGLRYGLYSLLFILSGTLSNETDKIPPTSISNSDNVNSKEINSKPIENTIRLINLNTNYFDENGNKIEPDENDITYKVIDVLDHTKSKARLSEHNFENISLLIEVSDYSKEVLKTLAFSIKKDYAKFAPNKCNLELWDSKEAYQKYLERDEYISKTFDNLMTEFKRTRIPFGDKHQAMKDKWDMNNYPFIADHLIATISLKNDFFYYMLQDNSYKKFGGKNYKK